MEIQIVLESIERIGKEIRSIYERFWEHFYTHPEYKDLWEELLRRQINQNDLVDKFKKVIPGRLARSSMPIGRDVNYEEILSAIETYKEDMANGIDINKALKIAFYMELMEIQGIFNELIKLPHEPFFDLLSDLHLEIRRNMSILVNAIEKYCTDQEFLYRVLEVKDGIVERRSGSDRRMKQEDFPGRERRIKERRQGKLVKIVCKI